MTKVVAFWDSGRGKRREYVLTELSADDFDAMMAAGNHHHVGMPIYWSHVITSTNKPPTNPPEVRIWPMAPTVKIEVDGVLADVPGDAVPPAIVSGAERDHGR